MPFDVVGAYRYAEDAAQVASCLMGNNPYTVNLVTVTNGAVNFNDPSNTRTRVNKRITVAAMFGGFLSYGPGDGYLNPYCTNTYDNNVVLAQQALTDMTWKVGPLVFPYTLNNINGGTDPNLFFPAAGSNKNTSIYLQLIGPALNTNNGNYFKITKMILGKGDNIYYYLQLENAGVVVP